ERIEYHKQWAETYRERSKSLPDCELRNVVEKFLQTLRMRVCSCGVNYRVRFEQVHLKSLAAKLKRDDNSHS
ncbi:UNVERIFIED_CONTAM: hypothetical protein NY603_21645, partial [Bacteroidetes bacterium 56_B9]